MLVDLDIKPAIAYKRVTVSHTVFNASPESHTQEFNPGVSSVLIDMIPLAMW